MRNDILNCREKPALTNLSRPEGFKAESKAEALHYETKAEAKAIKIGLKASLEASRPPTLLNLHS